MKKVLTYVVITLMFLAGRPLWPADKVKDEDRLVNSGTVLKEILDIPDDVPRDLLNKADCVIVFPSVVKAALIVGGSYGRGAMTCRSGRDFEGPWGAPTMMALEGGSIGLQLGGEATDFVLLVMNDRGAKCDPQQQGQAGRRSLRGGRSGGTRRVGRN